MRTYYIFEIKEEFYNLYYDGASTLYTILKQLFLLKKQDIDFGFTIFNQLVEKQDKYKLNKNIFIKYHKEKIYTKLGNEHIINNLYKDEISVLTIKNSYITVSTNHNYSSFFNILIDYSSKYFVVDFKNQDYFFLNNIKILV